MLLPALALVVEPGMALAFESGIVEPAEPGPGLGPDPCWGSPAERTGGNSYEDVAGWPLDYSRSRRPCSGRRFAQRWRGYLARGWLAKIEPCLRGGEVG